MHNINKPGPDQEHRISLALQGGGSLGAFAWGVLDRLLEEESLVFDTVSGASAGAMNAVILAAGLKAGGKAEARRRLDRFWTSASQAVPFSAGPVGALLTDMTSRLVSPYQLNPFNVSPLPALLEAEVDFEALRSDPPLRLLIAATCVQTGRLRIFHENELSKEMVLASATLPMSSHATEIEGESYWDGAYSANPPLISLVEASETSDILLVQIMPTEGHGSPRLAPDIVRRLDQVTFNGVLLREAAALVAMARVAGTDSQDPEFARKLRELRLHHISAERNHPDLRGASGRNLASSFLWDLRESGRRAAEAWLAKGIHEPVLQGGRLAAAA